MTNTKLTQFSQLLSKFVLDGLTNMLLSSMLLLSIVSIHSNNSLSLWSRVKI